MNSKKNNRRSLFYSVISLLLCISMLLGTTMAWFTDSVSSTGNIIKTGRLKVAMEYTDDLSGEWKDASNATIFEGNIWEPGYSDMQFIRVSNTGNLAFQYQMHILPAVQAADGEVDLADVIDVYLGKVEGNFTAPTAFAADMAGMSKLGTLAELMEETPATSVLLPVGAESTTEDVGSVTYCIVLHMQETAGNEYQNLTVGNNFTVQLVASQVGHEQDAFGNSYDASAEYPELVFPEMIDMDMGSADVTVDSGNKLTEDVILTGTAISATVKAGTLLNEGTTKLVLTVAEKDDTDANITLGENEELRALDVHVSGIADDNTVPVIISLGKVAPEFLNQGNLTLAHVENGRTVLMTQVMDLAELDAHNEFYYDVIEGELTVAMATFSEVAVVAEPAKWEGGVDHSWYVGKTSPYTIANADQLWSFSQIVGGMAEGIEQDSFSGKTVKLIADIDLGDGEEDGKIFYPIGYWNNEGTYERLPADQRKDAVSSGLRNFEGTFDGNGHTISNFYHNTWEMKGDHDWYDTIKEQYYRDGMGLFGRVYKGTIKNLTVKNFSSDGEIATTGVIAAYADGATFENIAIFDCNPRVYNIGNGGIVGCVGWYAKEANLKTTFKNITVDNSNKISALWGSYDVACGGLVGQYYPTSGQSSAGTPKNGGIHMENCHVSAQMDVYNDVCANYQYYAYRYAGMLIGSVRENETIDGKVYPKTDGITASGCTVNYGDWNDYYYCEFEKNGHPSYSGPDDYKFSRVPHSELNFTDSNGNGLVDLNERETVTGCKHDHTDAEDNRAIYLPFVDQLITGYGWGVTSKGLADFKGVDTFKVSEGEYEASVAKFEGKSNVVALEAGKPYTLGTLFSAVDNGIEIVDASVTVGITDLDDTDGVVTVDFNDKPEKWQDKTVTFNGIGDIAITIQDYYFCLPTTLTVEIAETENIASIDKFDKLFDKDFLYRVGNAENSPVALGSMFKAKDGATIGNVSVTIEKVAGSANGAYTPNATWTNGTIQFTGTGVVKVTITDNDYCTPTELKLEVVDAVNTTSAAHATSNNVVLLNDAGFSSLEVKNGYTLYGNGFTLTCSSDSAALDMGYAFVTMANGTLDNVQIVTPNFSHSILYKSNYGAVDDSGKRYYNIRSAVMVSGNCQILNSKISGGRAAVYATSGNILIDNTTITGGAAANIHLVSTESFVLRDVTLIQVPTEANVNDTSKTVMGFSIVTICDTEGKTPEITLEGDFVQYAWAHKGYSDYIPEATQGIVNFDVVSYVLGKEKYVHSITYADGTTADSVNLGICYLPDSKSPNRPTINDKRSNANTVVYSADDINGLAYVYSIEKNKTTDTTIGKLPDEYVPNKYGDIITVTYSDTADGLTAGKSFGTDGWVYELNVDLDKAAGYAVDFGKLSMSVNGVAVTDYLVNGGTKPTPVVVTAGGTTYTLTATVDGKEYTAYYKVTGTETSKESPSLVAANYEEGLCVASSYGGTWHGAAPALQGIQIKYWSVAEKQYKTINLSDYTPTTKGQQNGTNTTWTYSPANGDFTLTLTGGQVHSSNNVYAMPVVCNGKLYYVAASSKGLVNSGNSARTIPVTYTFEDNNNGDVLTFSHTWSVAENKDAQYKYSDFCSGTLTKLQASSGGGGSCLAEGTLITMVDGSKKAVENIRKGDKVMSFDHLTGELTDRDVIIVVKTYSDNYYKNTFVFDDGTELVTINEHGIYDLDLDKYVNIDHNNYAQYIGHSYVSVDVNGNLGVKKLVDVTTVCESGYKYDIVTNETLNYVAEDTLSVTHVLVDVINSFDFTEDMVYDQEKMMADIAAYGLYTYDEWEEYCDISVFEQYNIPVMKVGISKGLYTREYIISLINTYVLDESVQIID